MNEWFSGCITTLVALVLGLLVWEGAHSTIATECRKLGAFYVGQTVFECRVKE